MRVMYWIYKGSSKYDHTHTHTDIYTHPHPHRVLYLGLLSSSEMPLRALQIQLQASLRVTSSHDEDVKHNHLLLGENCPGLTEASQKHSSELNKKLMKNQISTSCTPVMAGGTAEVGTLKQRANSDPVRSLVFGVYISQHRMLSHTMISCPRAPRSRR